MKNGGDALHETAARGVEAIHMIVGQRDQLLTDSERMKTEIMLLREKNTQLDGRLSQAVAERDHYMRFCVELTTNLNNIQSTINIAIDAAKHASYRPSPISLPPKADAMTQADAEALEGLIKRLPASDGEPN